MKNLIYTFLTLSFLSLSIASCDLDLTNPNAATETQVLNTKDGLLALAVGINQTYSTLGLGSAILTPSVTTRETAIMTTFANLEELEAGGQRLSGENGYTVRLFTRIMKAKGMAEDLLENIDNVSMDPGTATGLQAWGGLFRAICLGDLANHFDMVAIENNVNNEAVYSDRTDAYNEALNILTTSISSLQSTQLTNEFNSIVSPGIDLLNSSRLLLARYHLFLGNYDAAIETANQVNLSSKSEFQFDGQNQNPVFIGMFDGTVSYAPRADFGLPEGLKVNPEDQRISFWIDKTQSANSLNNLPIATMIAPFYNTNTSPIPVYRPGEVLLILAEAYARKGEVEQAENYINRVRQKQPSEDIYGLGAGLPDEFTSEGDQQVLLNEIYKNRRLELFLTGMSLEDSRRFERPQPSADPSLTAERNRNFYPYPDNERQNNENTPNNPEI